MSVVDKWEYRQDQEQPFWGVDWRDSDGALIDFSAGWTFSVKLARSPTAVAALTKTTGITGLAGTPNIIVGWTTGQLNLTPGDYLVFLKATNINGDRRFMPGHEPTITILPTPVAS